MQASTYRDETTIDDAREIDDEQRWFEALPPGTTVTTDALRAFRWPVRANDPSGWLQVGCIADWSVERYALWFGALPTTGVQVDPADARFTELLCSGTQRGRHGASAGLGVAQASTLTA